LPRGVYVIAGFVAAGSILGFAYLIFGNSTALVIIALGLVLVVALLYVYRALLGWMRKRKANPLSQSLAGNAAAAPQGISEPARRARLDDLRRNFEQGVEKFRAAGKNLYSVPWYVLVGEPGSGKTEAIRHCNVGFPPGLQDQLQGAGGTLNMNWWFTNQAIILDTAGRLMFEEVPPGSTNEWQEFLKLLKQNRPNCPINGLLLVIPVDTLIKDSADSIEKKAGKIAQQFDQIQRTLGVRFPVFTIITKCDLLNGFREFFDDLNDPQLQHQIMGR
jgi:type VI protein secretion system component VasK